MGPRVRLLRWLLPAVILVVLFPARASADTGTLFIDSQAGDVVGAGTPRTFTHELVKDTLLCPALTRFVELLKPRQHLFDGRAELRIRWNRLPGSIWRCPDSVADRNAG
jgi:hypothetical protein